MTIQMLTESVLPIWILFLVLAPVGLILTFWLIRKSCGLFWQNLSWRKFHRANDGASYSFAYLIIIPPYLILMFCLVECTLILLTKMGTVYAAFAGARSAVVYYSQQDPTANNKRLMATSDVLEKARTNSAQAMIPFASGMSRYQKGIPYVYGEDDFVRSYEQYYDIIESPGSVKASSKYLKRKYRYAMTYTQIETPLGNKRPESWDSDVDLKLTYYYPFQFSIIGRIFGQPRMNGYYVRPITTTVTLQNEGPQNKDQRLGIHYGAY